METLVFAAPGVEETRSVVQQLEVAGVAHERIHVTAKDKGRLSELNVDTAIGVESSDVANAFRRGAVIGAIIGVVIGTAVWVLQHDAIGIGAATIVAIALVSTGIGAWAGSMIGVSEPNPALDAIEDELKSGKIAILVEVENEKERQRVVSKVHEVLPNVTVREANMTGGTNEV